MKEIHDLEHFKASKYYQDGFEINLDNREDFCIEFLIPDIKLVHEDKLYKFGDFRGKIINLCINDSGSIVTKVKAKSLFHHPHISTTLSLCLGGKNSRLVQEYFNQGYILPIISCAEMVLCNYGNNAYRHINSFTRTIHSAFSVCYICSKYHNEVYTCSKTQKPICRECHHIMREKIGIERTDILPEYIEKCGRCSHLKDITGGKIIKRLFVCSSCITSNILEKK